MTQSLKFCEKLRWKVIIFVATYTRAKWSVVKDKHIKIKRRIFFTTWMMTTESLKREKQVTAQRLFVSSFRTRNSCGKLWGYWTKVHQIFGSYVREVEATGRSGGLAKHLSD